MPAGFAGKISNGTLTGQRSAAARSRMAIPCEAPTGTRSVEHAGWQARWASRYSNTAAVHALPPYLAAALDELDFLERRDRPKLAAHWVAQGLGGNHLVDLAGLHGHEPEVSDLWPLGLAEVGVSLPVHRARRTALPWLTARMSSPQEDLPWLLRVLWPSNASDSDDDELLDQVVCAMDAHLDYLGALEENRSKRRLSLSHGRDDDLRGRLRAEVAAATEALTRGDVDGAAATLGLT
jgi:hypothetical protein